MTFSNWIEIGNLCNFINGGAWNQEEYAIEGIPVLQVSNIKNDTIDTSDIKKLDYQFEERYEKHKLQENDLVIATVGSHPTVVSSAVGRAVIIPKKGKGFYLNQNAVCIRPIDEAVLVVQDISC